MSPHDALDRSRSEDPSFIADPYPAHDALRAQGPIHFNERTGHWLVTRHADVNALLRDRCFGRTYLHVATHADMGRAAEPASHAPFWHLIRDGMLDREPPWDGRDTSGRTVASGIYYLRFESEDLGGTRKVVKIE